MSDEQLKADGWKECPQCHGMEFRVMVSENVPCWENGVRLNVLGSYVEWACVGCGCAWRFMGPDRVIE